MKDLYIKTETSGLPLWKAPSEDPGQPWVILLALELWEAGQCLEEYHTLIDPRVVDETFEVSTEITGINGITTGMLVSEGVTPIDAWDNFRELLGKADRIVGFNVSFDIRMMRIFNAKQSPMHWENTLPTVDVMSAARDVCRIEHSGRGQWKNPKLTEAHELLIGEPFPQLNLGRSNIAAIRAVHTRLQSMGASE